MNDSLSCPHCGSKEFERCYKAIGTWRQNIKILEDGRVEVQESNTDGIRQCHIEPKTLLCHECGRRVKNFIPSDSQTVTKEY